MKAYPPTLVITEKGKDQLADSMYLNGFANCNHVQSCSISPFEFDLKGYCQISDADSWNEGFFVPCHLNKPDERGMIAIVSKDGDIQIMMESVFIDGKKPIFDLVSESTFYEPPVAGIAIDAILPLVDVGKIIREVVTTGDIICFLSYLDHYKKTAVIVYCEPEIVTDYEAAFILNGLTVLNDH